MTPEQFISHGPQTPDDLIGAARIIAKVQCSKAQKNTVGTPVKLLLYGEPGCGKSATCTILSKHFAPVFIVERVSGQQITADIVRQWISDSRFSSSAWCVRIIEEVDLVSQAAEALLLQYLDILPKFYAMICTSNKNMGQLSDRFQSRFQAIEVERPEPVDVCIFLEERWPEMQHVVAEISLANNGDVRASLNDLQTHIDKAKFS